MRLLSLVPVVTRERLILWMPRVLPTYGLVSPSSASARRYSEPDREGLRQQSMDDQVQELNRLDKEIEQLNEGYRELLRHSVSLHGQAVQYQTVPGVGQFTATILPAYLPELGEWEARSLT